MKTLSSDELCSFDYPPKHDLTVHLDSFLLSDLMLCRSLVHLHHRHHHLDPVELHHRHLEPIELHHDVLYVGVGPGHQDRDGDRGGDKFSVLLKKFSMFNPRPTGCIIYTSWKKTIWKVVTQYVLSQTAAFRNFAVRYLKYCITLQCLNVTRTCSTVYLSL